MSPDSPVHLKARAGPRHRVLSLCDLCVFVVNFLCENKACLPLTPAYLPGQKT
jgi:hypothetical protein